MISTGSVTPSDQPNTHETSESAVAMFDGHGTVVGWTHAARQLVGYTAREVVGRSAAHVLPPPEERRGARRSSSSVVPRVAGPAPWRSATASATRSK